MKKLFEKGQIGSCVIKNRVVMPSMTPKFTELDGQPNERLIQYYEERARGGVGLIMSEVICVNDRHGRLFPRQISLINPENVTKVREMTDRIHAYDCKMFGQLHHPGNVANPLWNNGRIYGVSSVPGISGVEPVAFTTEEIEQLVQEFITAAVRCKGAGFDGVELHGAHGYLISQFMSAYYNNRTDKYGGDYEGRARFAVEIIRGIKAACGRNYPVTIRLSGDEFAPQEGSIKLEDTIEFAKIYEEAGADAIDLSSCNYYSMWTGTEPVNREQGWKAYLGQAVKAAVSVPVITTCNVKYPEIAEELLSDGTCDFIATARAQLADPEWCRKTKTGRADEIRNCIGCVRCFMDQDPLIGVHCSVNPRLGRESVFNERTIKNNGGGRVIAVVGGGPAGMQASVTLAQRGFDVTLYDEHGELGGNINTIIKLAAYKDKIRRFRDVLKREMEAAGVKVRLNTRATPELVSEIRPEAVFLACGAGPVIPELPGIHGSNVYMAADVVGERVELTGSTVIIGSGQTGMEAAEKLFAQGKSSVTIVDMADRIGTGIDAITYHDLMEYYILPYKPVMLTRHKLLSIEENGVRLENTDTGDTRFVEAENVVLSLGVVPDRELIGSFESAFWRVVPVGDAITGGKIGDAIRSGYISAFGFDPEI